MPDLATAAREAYLAGWAISDGPLTGRVRAGCGAAVLTAIDHRDDPAILEAALTLGHLEGVQALIRQRREDLLAKHLKTVTAAWNACMKELGSPRAMVRRFRRDTYLTAEARDPQKQWWQDTAIATALGWLRGVDHTDGYDALIAALEDAIRDGMAEGEADALALAASKLGKTGLRIDDAFKAAYANLAGTYAVTQQAAASATSIIDGAGNDTGRRLASLAPDGTEDDMTDAAGDVTSGRDIRAVTSWTDWAVWAAIGAGALRLFAAAGIGLVNWDDAGDSRECQTCIGNAAGSPYSYGSVPAYPAHPRCRCEIDAADSSPLAAYLAAFLS